MLIHYSSQSFKPDLLKILYWKYPTLINTNEHVHLKFYTYKLFYISVAVVPVCRPGQPKVFGVARHESAKIACELEANPTDVEFIWKFNNTADTFEIPQSQVNMSEAEYLQNYYL